MFTAHLVSVKTSFYVASYVFVVSSDKDHETLIKNEFSSHHDVTIHAKHDINNISLTTLCDIFDCDVENENIKFISE